VSSTKYYRPIAAQTEARKRISLSREGTADAEFGAGGDLPVRQIRSDRTRILRGNPERSGFAGHHEPEAERVEAARSVPTMPRDAGGVRLIGGCGGHHGKLAA
jgi:hypothetical protein